MSAFNDLNDAAQGFSEELMGDSFTYNATNTFTGVFAQVEVQYELEGVGMRMTTADTVVTRKAQWVTAGVVPADRKTVTVGAVAYTIFRIDGINSAGEPAYTLYLKRLT